ncbi:anti-sigma factor antagonist [Lentzea sp. NPDC051213]|uniref:anti-sigma factor antagonist n=1 Tax=Lentzea sp. NPDC051213 TaxID=3364126 RepID=UPI00379A7666
MHTDSVPFHITSERVGDTVVVHVAGELDCSTADELTEALVLAELEVVPPAPVVVDLTELRFLGAAGIGVLLDHQDLCLRRGGVLLVVANSTAVLRPIRALELADVLCLRASTSDACAYSMGGIRR